MTAKNIVTTENTDLLVIGGGAAGMTTALCASIEGLEVVLCEKSAQVGGTMSTSGGTTWIPGNSLGSKVGRPDSVEEADQFLRHVVGNRGGDALRGAFLASGSQAIDYLAQHSDVFFEAAREHPDYLDGPGFAFGGRALSPLPFDGKQLGKNFERLRPPREEFLGFGGMMVSRHELGKLLTPFKSWDNVSTSIRVVGQYLLDRLRYKRGTRLLMGNALAGRLFYSLIKRSVPILFETKLVEILQKDNVVVGAVLETPHGLKRIMTRCGIVLATGGISWNHELRQKYFPVGVANYSLAPVSNTGDGAVAALNLGADFCDGGDSPALWMPCSSYRRSDGKRLYWPHILLDRAKPGLLAVRRDGKRFVNEADSYHDFCQKLLKDGGSVPAYLVCDDRFIRKYGLGFVLPGGRGLAALQRNGYLEVGKTIEGLAQKTGINPRALRQTVDLYNGYAMNGIDREFNRGSSNMNKFNGDPANAPNPCLAPLEQGPFYAVQVEPIDLACSAGIVADEFGRVTRQTGEVIPGLFACGNDVTSIFRGTYPGPGTTLGPAITFAWRIVQHLKGRLS